MAPHEPEHTARRLHQLGEPADVVAARLLTESGTEPWAVPVLRRAATDAARGGDIERAAALIRRALDALPAVLDLDRVRLIIELGRLESAAGRVGAARRWETAADQLRSLEPTERVSALVDLGEATYSSGQLGAARDHFAAAHELCSRSDAGDRADDETRARIVAGLSTSSLLTGRRHADVAVRLRSIVDDTPTYPDLATRALMASAAGEVALGVDMPASLVHRLVDGALGEAPLPAPVLRPVFEPLSAALSLTGRPDAAVTLLDAQLQLAADRNDLVSHVSLLALRAHAHLVADDLHAARDDASDALALILENPNATRLAEAPARYALSVALIELDDHAAAEDVCDVADHARRWGGTPMHGWFLDGAARVHAAAHRHDRAIRDWRSASREFTLIGGSGIICEWRDGLARSLHATGERDGAQLLAEEQHRLAERFGDERMMAIARSTTAAVESDHRRAADVLGEALSALPRDRSELTRCRLGYERGLRLRQAGLRRAARDQLVNSSAIAYRVGARRLVRLIDAELTAAGATVRGRAAPNRRVELSAAEHQTAELAADGLSNVQIAQRRAVSRKTVEAQLTSVYRKLGVADRSALRGALDGRADRR